MRFMIHIDSHPLALSKNEARRWLRLASPFSALKPIISSHARVVIDFVVGIVIVRFHAAAAGSFRNHAAGRKQ
jgi:hypothetical protein